MNRVFWSSLLAIVALVCASSRYTENVSSNSLDRHTEPAFSGTSNLTPLLATTFDVDRTDDTAAATACTVAPNDCSLRGAIIASNADVSGMPITINLQPATTYNLTLANATQENAAATGDLDITTTNHSVTIVGGGSSGLNATIIDASGLNSGNMRDRAFQITGAGITAVFQDLVIRNGIAADDGRSGMSTDPTSQNAPRAGGGILNGAGINNDGSIINGGGMVTLNNVLIQSCQAVGKGDSVINNHTTLDAWGGALASLGAGTVIITNSTLSGNIAQGGNGGNFNNGSGSFAKGGSIYFGGGTLNIDLSRIENSNANGGNGGNVDQNGMTNGGSGGLAQGGGVWIGAGTATINNTTFKSTVANAGNSGNGGNSSGPAGEADGGGLYSLGIVTITNSTFDSAGANGGDAGDAFGTTCIGAHNAGDGGAARGGAIFADGGSMIVDTSTFANNSAVGGDGGDGGQTDGGLNCGMHGAGGLAYGGAITNNAATLNIKHATISLNNAQAGNTGVNQGGANKPPRLVAEGTGGGIRVGPGSVTIENTIIAGNTAGNGLGDVTGAPTPGPNVDGAVTSNGHNLLGTATEATGFTGTGDLSGANPMLAPLADNGGPTQTMLPAATSPAIDAGVAAGATTDQRGKPRTFDDPAVVNAATSDGTDIGAVEVQPECTLTCPSNITVPNDPGVCGATVTYTTPSGAGCGTVTCDHPSGSFFPVGDTTVICTSSVGPTCNFKVTVNDTEAPVITPKGPIEMWPPNHQYQTFNVTDLVASVTDNCDSISVTSVVISSVSSDEPENTTGDGNTTDDILIGGTCKSVQLRSERMGDGNGRVYTITLEVADESGNVGTATAKVTVPHSQDGTAAVDDGPVFVVNGCTPSRLEVSQFFVQQQYEDFLGRAPDPSGFNFWVNNIESCGVDLGCWEDRRIDTSAAFFLSTEFQQTGYLVYRTYHAAYGDLPNAPVPIRWSDFKTDTRQIGKGVVVLQQGWEQILEQNKQAFMLDFVQRGSFITAYPVTMSPSQFVNQLFGNADVQPTGPDRSAAISEFGSASNTSDVAARARALRLVAENTKLEQADFNRAFVLIEYFGFLRRDPNSSPDTDYSGYQFWLDKLDHFKGNFRDAQMVQAFLTSIEYRKRFER